MSVAFKYMKFRCDFFDRPSLSLTRPAIFNDPFEYRLGRDYHEFIRLGVGERLTGFDKRLFDAGSYKHDINECLRENGVVSLSGEFDNILMWSHYADSHYGIVVEFDLDAWVQKFPPNLSFGDNGFTVEFANVDYSDQYCAPESGVLLTVKDVVRHKLQRKARCWDYEKEIRVIASLNYADRAIFQFKDEFDTVGKIIEKIKKDSSGLGEKIDRGLIKFTNIEKGVEFYRDGCDVYWSQDMGREWNLTFLVDVEPSFIKRIYFGYWFSDKNLESIKNKIKGNTAWRHVQFFKCALHDIDFKLNFSEVNI